MKLSCDLDTKVLDLESARIQFLKIFGLILVLISSSLVKTR